MNPALTVVIPTYRRETRLAFALEALAEQSLAPSLFEVIVVAHVEHVLPPGLPDDLDVRVLVQPGAGPSVRRNLGWREGHGELVVFTDDDCRPSPHWLEALLERHLAESGGAVVLQGCTAPDPDERNLWGNFARSISVDGPNRWFPTCNLALPRSLLERLDGFDEQFAFHCEDTDLGLRAEAVGASLVYVEEAIVFHAVHNRSLRTAVRDAFERTGEAALVRRHPGHRAVLHLGVFVTREHARFTLAALGLLLLPRFPRASPLAAGPYVASKFGGRLIHSNLPLRWRLIQSVVDVLAGVPINAAEVAARLGASARNRTLVL